MRVWTVTIGIGPGLHGQPDPFASRVWVHVCADDRGAARLSGLDCAARVLSAIGERTDALTVERLAMDPPRRWDEDTLRGRRSGDVYYVELRIAAS
jgi:hypothetical protein